MLSSAAEFKHTALLKWKSCTTSGAFLRAGVLLHSNTSASLTAFFRSCSEPKYRSVVRIDSCPTETEFAPVPRPSRGRASPPSARQIVRAPAPRFRSELRIPAPTATPRARSARLAHSAASRARAGRSVLSLSLPHPATHQSLASPTGTATDRVLFPFPGNPETPSGRRASPDARSSCATILRGATRTSPALRQRPVPHSANAMRVRRLQIMSGLFPRQPPAQPSTLLAHPGDRDNRLRRLAVHVPTALGFLASLRIRRQGVG